jgi:hypothetical protein
MVQEYFGMDVSRNSCLFGCYLGALQAEPDVGYFGALKLLDWDA